MAPVVIDSSDEALVILATVETCCTISDKVRGEILCVSARSFVGGYADTVRPQPNNIAAMTKLYITMVF